MPPTPTNWSVLWEQTVPQPPASQCLWEAGVWGRRTGFPQIHVRDPLLGHELSLNNVCTVGCSNHRLSNRMSVKENQADGPGQGEEAAARPAGMMPILTGLGTSAALGWFWSTPAFRCVLPIRPCKTSLNMPSPPTQTILQGTQAVRVPPAAPTVPHSLLLVVGPEKDNPGGRSRGRLGALISRAQVPAPTAATLCSCVPWLQQWPPTWVPTLVPRVEPSAPAAPP